MTKLPPVPSTPRRACLIAAACALPLALSGCWAEGDDADDTVLHLLDDSRQVFPESVAVAPDGTFYVGSVKEGTLYRGRLGEPAMAVFSPAGADGRTIANGMFSNRRHCPSRSRSCRYRCRDARLSLLGSQV